jgi:hypothetical protein
MAPVAALKNRAADRASLIGFMVGILPAACVPSPLVGEC